MSKSGVTQKRRAIGPKDSQTTGAPRVRDEGLKGKEKIGQGSRTYNSPKKSRRGIDFYVFWLFLLVSKKEVDGGTDVWATPK